MSEGGHHHGGDMGGQPAFLPAAFPLHEHHHHDHHIADPADPSGASDLMPPAYGRRRPGVRRYRPSAGSPAWVGLWIVRLAVLAFIIFLAYQVIHGAN